jgi:tight adherence protein C
MGSVDAKGECMSALPLQILIAVLFAALAFLLAISLIPTKSVLSEQLDALKARESVAVDSKRLGFLERAFGGERRAWLRQQLIEAGWYTDTPAKFLLRVAAGACFGMIAALFLWQFFSFPFIWMVLVSTLLVFAGAYFPFIVLNRASEARKAAIQKTLPEFLDMVASTVQAGLALNAALAYAVDAAPGPLGEEIREALSEVRLGRPRADALRAVGERANQPDLRNALRVVTQAERMGANVAKLLNDLAEEARSRRLMLVEEMAGKLPVKMTLPMIVCMIPSIFVVIFGSVAANYFAPK